MGFNRLPNELLVQVLRCIPLQELLSHRPVCTRSAIEHIFALKQSLKMFGQTSDLASYFGAIKFDCDDREFALSKTGQGEELIGVKDALNGNPTLAHSIVDLFPNVRKLVLASCYRYESSTVKLVEMYSELVSLVLTGIPEYTQNLIVQQINQLPDLSALHLLFGHFSHLLPEEMPILAQLHKFTLSKYRNDILPVLNQLGPNLAELRLREICSSVDELSEWIDKSVPKDNKLVKLILTQFVEYPDFSQFTRYITRQKQLVPPICERFTSLTFLEFGPVDWVDLKEILEKLAKLKQLSDLRFLVWDWTKPMGIIRGSAQLVSLVRLQLNLNFSATHCQFPGFDLSEYRFPRLKQITIATVCSSPSANARLLNSARQHLNHYTHVRQEYRDLSDDDLYKCMLEQGYLGIHEQQYRKFYNG